MQTTKIVDKSSEGYPPGLPREHIGYPMVTKGTQMEPNGVHSDSQGPPSHHEMRPKGAKAPQWGPKGDPNREPKAPQTHPACIATKHSSGDPQTSKSVVLLK